MSSSLNRLSPPLAAPQAAVSSVTALAVERLGEGASFDLDAWEIVPTEYRAWRAIERECDRLSKVLESVPVASQHGRIWIELCERVDLLSDQAADAETAARRAFRKVAA